MSVVDPTRPTSRLVIEYVSPSKLKPAEYNPRKIEPDALKALTRGIEQFGLVDPLIVRRSDNLVIGGHQRLKVAQKQGLTEVPVVYLDVDDVSLKRWENFTGRKAELVSRAAAAQKS